MTPPPSTIEPVQSISVEACRGLKGLLSDLDDTLTHGGRLVPAAFEALSRAHAAGLRTVLVTGRPAGWVDHFARMWPVDAVVGENGAFYFRMDGGRMRRRWVDDAETRARNRERLSALAESIPRAVPGSLVSADQFCRATDLAIDFCEEVPPLPAEAVDMIVHEFESAGATAKVSSIHVNGWFGQYDKLSCMRLVAEELWGEDLEEHKESYIYCGDSPNDEPMFAFFPLAAGVANIGDFISRLSHKPAFVTDSPGGVGFAELVGEILAKRGLKDADLMVTPIR